MNTETFHRGDRVSTPKGPGNVAYVRMAPPDYARPAAVSVVLDATRHTLGYTGTIFAATDVRATEDNRG